MTIQFLTLRDAFAFLSRLCGTRLEKFLGFVKTLNPSNNRNNPLTHKSGILNRKYGFLPSDFKSGVLKCMI